MTSEDMASYGCVYNMKAARGAWQQQSARSRLLVDAAYGKVTRSGASHVLICTEVHNVHSAHYEFSCVLYCYADAVYDTSRNAPKAGRECDHEQECNRRRMLPRRTPV